MKSEVGKPVQPGCRVIWKTSVNPRLAKGRDGKHKLIVRDLTLRVAFDGEIRPAHGKRVHSSVG